MTLFRNGPLPFVEEIDRVRNALIAAGITDFTITPLSNGTIEIDSDSLSLALLFTILGENTTFKIISVP